MPGYHNHLPKVFPLKKNLDIEHVVNLLGLLVDNDQAGFAVTRHPKSLDGHVTLWLSQEAAEFLVSQDYISGLEQA